MLKRIKNNIRMYLKKRFNFEDFNRFQKISFSQTGEDLIIRHVFNRLNIEKPSYIDIGAHHPFYLSNTALFYSQGSRGINIEPAPALFQSFIENRPEDTNLNIGIAKEPGEILFYIMSDQVLNTFSNDEAVHLESEGFKIIDTKIIAVKDLKSIINDYCNGVFPDFMSLDAEGIDEEILQNIDFAKSSPTVICVETITFSMQGKGIKRKSIFDLLETNGYLAYADTNINTIFVRKDKWIK